MSAPGSHKRRKEVFKALSAYTQIQKTPDVSLLVESWERLEAILPEFLSTDDGSDPMEALDEVSADQFDQLCIGLLGVMPTVPEAKSAS